ncbi:peptidase insulinase-like peptidase [Cryptosporidium xiaoi]|uniref:Peptidase insulinase-like peptidase n=1 Tax=Cryptosporidium xiaoi TaxID=659607 RepID=A0AAV9Y3F4_9CRYT
MPLKNDDFELIAQVLSKSPLVHRSDILYEKLSDGLDYCIFNSEAVKNTFFLSLVINVGSIHEDDNERGLANFIQNLTLTELNDKLSNIRSDHILNITSSTDFHCTIHNIVNELNSDSMNDPEKRETFFDVLGKFLECVYKLQSNLMLSSDSFLGKIESIKNKTLSNIQETSDSVANIIERKIFSQFHGHTILPKRWPIGECSTVESFTISNMLKFLQKWYLPSNMCLFIVGDIPVSNKLLATHLSTFISDLNCRNTDANDTKLNSEYNSKCNIFSVNNRIGYKGIIDRISLKSKNVPQKDLNFEKELLYQHESIEQISISIGIKLDICPLLDEGEIFYNAIDTIISNLIHSKLLGNLDNNIKSKTSISWDFYNSARENCGWNTFSIVTDESNWKNILKSSIQEIKNVCNKEMTKEEFDEVVLITISDYKKAAEDEYCEDPKLVLDGLIDDWLCGSIPISKKQEYQLFCKILDYINPNIIKNRCNYLFGHILNYFTLRNENLSVNSACIFVSKPLTLNSESCDGIENSLTFSNSGVSNKASKCDKFMDLLLSELKQCINSDLKESNKGEQITFKNTELFSNTLYNENEYYIKNRLIDEKDFGIWDAFKASAFIAFEKLVDKFRFNLSMISFDEENITPENLATLNGCYSVKQLDKIAERISCTREESDCSNYKNGNINTNSEFQELYGDICDLGLVDEDGEISQ